MWGPVLAAVLVQSVFFAGWMYRRKRSDDVTRVFVRDIATNHLPHVYGALRRIADYHGIPLEEPPLVQFIDFDAERKVARKAS